ncbi:RagB/SusD family nutrient uptake outer membrane protein [Mucilaginibacter aquaedulcis]|uniref:RagB/SusD family nutrient uptake outer membrane protein n=1 Tax=Mucilaginibacter aquaedulcis TaxID=1187081 RepID=UPI0025B541E7|nr:RagB/SusD family nutrient uptake outer membrane protein [Mucilaginibacter aquaedulcis]MDN3546939.1 RagB/SusD family nutrient uptake outer membrane protein [Mucilaginibacter aquaedulcis]
MKKIYLSLLILFTLSSSCKKFLVEKTNGILTPDNYYNNAQQIRAAVDGAYLGLNSPFATGIGVATSSVFSLEYITGYCQRPRPSGNEDNQFIQLAGIDQANGALATWWTSSYYPIENCNSIIANVSKTSVIAEPIKNNFLAEAYFLRAYYYFQLVRLYGRVPLKTTPTTSLDNTQLERSSIDDIYKQIVTDLTTAEQAGLNWTDKTGHVSKGAIKSLLAKVYITMAGFPLNKGQEYYQKAYTEASEVIQSGQFNLFANYSDLRNPSNYNSGEHIFMIQHDENTIPNIMHFTLMPYPELPISIQPSYSGAMAPAASFYSSYQAGDQRVKEKNFYYTEHEQYGDASKIIRLPMPYIYKYWNDQAEISGRDGSNFPLIRYADVLLICAEASASINGSTNDATATAAYNKVHQRAFPSAPAVTTVALDDVLKERYWELAYEFQTWYDMMRTRKAFDVDNNKIVDIIGYKAPLHNRPFTEADLLWPIPLTEVQKDPNLSK